MSGIMVIFGGLFFGGMGFVGLYWLVVSLARGDVLAAVTAVGVAAFCFGLVMRRLRYGRAQVRGRVDGSGTTFLPDKILDLSTQAISIGGFIAMSLIAIFLPTGKLDMPVPSAAAGLTIPFSGAAGAIAALPLVISNLKHRTTEFLRLTPTGFETYSGISVTKGQWAEVTSVAESVPGGTTTDPSLIVIVMSDGKTASLSAGPFTPNGHALRELVRFYWSHPEHRNELCDGTALTRLRNENFNPA
jgi:hypothetical protein